MTEVPTDRESGAGQLPPDEALDLENRPAPELVLEPTQGDPWVAKAVIAVEESIDALVDEFRAHPFAHRVEHSWHVRLVQLLSKWPVLQGSYPLGDAPFQSQLIHKEWPETYGELLLDGSRKRRGSFDIAILTPDQLRQTSVDQFRLGQIAAPIVVELGLGYWDRHLLADEKKLKDSRVQHGYLVHLSRMPSRNRKATEAIIEGVTGLRLAYVHHDISGRKVRYRHLGGAEITESAYTTN
jgi:hypothetical protein